MNLQGQRGLLLLTELDCDGAVTQRCLATKLTLVPRLTNYYAQYLPSHDQDMSAGLQANLSRTVGWG
jgi:hypothetical protein